MSGHKNREIENTQRATLDALGPVFRLLRDDRDALLAVVVYAVAVGVLSLATPVGVQALVGTVAFGTLLQPVLVLAALVFAGLAFAALLRALQYRVVETIQVRAFVRLAFETAHRIPRAKAEGRSPAYDPELVNRFFDVATVQKATASLLLDGVALVLQAAVGLSVLAFYHPALLAFDVALLVAVGLVIRVLGREGVETSVGESKEKHAVAAWLEEVSRHPYVFRTKQGADLAARGAAARVESYVAARGAHFRIVARQADSLLALQALASAGLLALGGVLVVGNRLTLGQLVASELIVTGVVSSLAKLGKHLESAYDLAAAADKVAHLTDVPLETGRQGVAFDEDPRGARLCLSDVVFDDAAAGSDAVALSLAVEPGEKILVTGGVGKGKSALAEVLFGQRPPLGGSLEFDGVDVRDVEPLELRSRSALLGASLEIVEGTIAENVAAGSTSVGTRDVWAALRAVGLEGRVRRLPDGIDTALRAAGGPLSSVEARLVGVARVLANKPRLVLLDGVLGTLDRASRTRVLEVLAAADAPWTLIVLEEDAAHGGGGPGRLRRVPLGPSVDRALQLEAAE